MKKLIRNLLLTSLFMSSMQSQAGVIIAVPSVATSLFVLAKSKDPTHPLSVFVVGITAAIGGVGGAIAYAGHKTSGTWGKVLLVLDEGLNAGFFKFIDENKTLGQLESSVAKEFLADTLSSKFDNTKPRQELKLTEGELETLFDLEGIESETELGKKLTIGLL